MNGEGTGTGTAKFGDVTPIEAPWNADPAEALPGINPIVDVQGKHHNLAGVFEAELGSSAWNCAADVDARSGVSFQTLEEDPRGVLRLLEQGILHPPRKGHPER